MPFVTDVVKSIETFCKIKFTTSDQHIDATDARIRRDKKDLDAIIHLLKKLEPLKKSDLLMCLTTGDEANSTVNCHEAYEHGIKLVENSVGKSFGDLKFKKADRITPLQNAYKVLVGNEIIELDPTLLFQRLAAAVELKDLKSYLTYELAPWPQSIFEKGFLRKTEKSKMYENFNTINEPSLNNFVYVFDGGFLLHKVVWPKNQKFANIFAAYLNYVLKFKNDMNNILVIFDGYENEGLKDEERRLREMKQSKCNNVDINVNKMCSIPQEKFLSNRINKMNFIKHLCSIFNNENIRTEIAAEDADALIVHKAVKEACNGKTSVIVGQDTDLLVLLVQLCKESDNVYFLKLDAGDKKTWYGPKSFCDNNLRPYVALLHSFCGCDSTSAFFYIGKNKIIKKLQQRQYKSLLQELHIFYNENANKQKISEVGKKIIFMLYTNLKIPCEVDLNELRYSCYKKGIQKRAFTMAKLPPTESAATQHSYRVYCQIMKWLNLNSTIIVTEWGWEKKRGQLYPKMICETDKLVPDDILKNVSCKCKKKLLEKLRVP